MFCDDDLVKYVQTLHQRYKENMKTQTFGPFKVTNQLYIGSTEEAISTGQLQELGINTLFNCAASSDVRPMYAQPPAIRHYYHIEADDLEKYQIRQHFDFHCWMP